MRWLLVLAVALAGCANSEVAPFPDEPIHSGKDQAEPPETHDPDGFACDTLPMPEAWYGHADGSLWCVPDPGWAGAGGSVVAPGLSLRDAYEGSNGSAGHAAGRPVEAHVKVLCWSGACLADVTVVVSSDGKQVARLAKQQVVVDAILLGGAWVDLDGALDAPVPPGGVFTLDVEVSGVGPLMLVGYAGSDAPWFQVA